LIRYVKNIEFLSRQAQTDLSSLADQLDIDFSDIRRPSAESLIKLSDHFKINVDALLKADLAFREDIKSKKIKLLIMDVDGVLTDGGLYYSENGDEMKKFNSKDGLAIKALKEKGIMTGIISNSHNTNIISKRCKVLGIDFYEVNYAPKLQTLMLKCKELDINPNQVVYIGDDLNDEAVLKAVGVSACPADAVEQIKKSCRIILSKKGGEGCVRELIDDYLM
jgi:3-deoxy-D-manno-octulosonate 8-phosphate phosphatase (KDO 8-P phosphatase)